MSITTKLAAENLLSPEQVERIQRNVADFVKAANEDPELREEVIQKLAIDPSIWPDIGKTLAFMATAAAIEIGAKGAYDVYRGVKDRLSATKNFRDMMEKNPDLKSYDQNKVQAAFNTLQKFNPDYASDPGVAGTFVQNAMDMARVDVSTINALVDARKKIQGDKPDYLTVAPFLKEHH